MPRALVTGGAGLLGSHLCERLLAEGWEVLCFDSLLTGNAENLSGPLANDRFRFERYDVTNHLHVEGDLDWIFHFASPASPTDYLEHPIHTLKVGALGTMRALGLAKAKRSGFMLASTSEVYGDPLVHPQPESYWGNVNPIGPRGVYDEAKRFAEAMAMAYHRAHERPGQDHPDLQHLRAPDAAQTTGGPFRRSSTRHSTASRSRCTEMAPRRDRCATSTT